MTLTQTEIVELRIAIAEEMGWRRTLDFDRVGSHYHHCLILDNCARHIDSIPPYTTSVDAIQAACLERFKLFSNSLRFSEQLGIRTSEIANTTGPSKFIWQLTALDWCIAFARTAKIWRFK